ncbi:hypothetical protein LTR62_000456 [Meristemomyces frigidus]|uniref:Trafficking protein particle complex subunit 11 domain-containing protein n=1 Tax=Meristemomyces frigidus TaxID=1508187 RepID=A0AAN7TNY8_9PEZI|nr:hypothetical protein LTR62_000456 [Meristemomyces frigidus]
MEAYPAEYSAHELPLVILSGLGTRPDIVPTGGQSRRQESGARISTSSKECSGDRARLLLEQLLKQDGSSEAWSSPPSSGPQTLLPYRIRTIGRNYTLPARKAAPLPQSPSADGFQNQQAGQFRSTELHSPLSPLSPGSPIYPDGVFTPLWLAKHQWQVPAAFIAFFELSSGDDTAQNEQLQIDINAIRTALSRSGFKTKFAAVLLSDKSILRTPELEDRLSAIRRATTLDPKSGLFFMPPMSSQAEIATFVQSMLTTLQPLIVDYYRDLTKHSRRKKTRGGSGFLTSPVDGGAHALSTPGWNVRYDFKQGVYAEFRQEMDVAERHYSAAIDELFSSDGILEATPSWSPRWNEARLLCDVVALRVVRCQLWMSSTTGATLSWVNYRARVRDLVDRRGKGTQTYAWDAWESRWAEIMAQLIRRAAIPALQASDANAADESVELARFGTYAMPERAYAASERIPPFYLLHHPGYWLRMAVESTRARREKAMNIPDEDCIPPGQSPASSVAHRATTYDTYLVPAPHEEHPHAKSNSFDHLAETERLASAASKEFAGRGQMRASELLKLQLAQLQESAKMFEQALAVALPVWEECTWREDGWDSLFVPLLTLVQRCAAKCGNAHAHISATWELMKLRPDVALNGSTDLPSLLALTWPDHEEVHVQMHDRQRHSPIDVQFAFRDKGTNAGDHVECQLSLISRLAPYCKVAAHRMEISMSNGETVTIDHEDSESQEQQDNGLVDLSAKTKSTDGKLMLHADLNLERSHERTYSFPFSFRETGEVLVQSITIWVKADFASIEHKFSEPQNIQASLAYIRHAGRIEQRELPFTSTATIIVRPKPPKMQILLRGLHDQHYTNEHLSLDVELVNEEEEAVQVTAVASFSGEGLDLAIPSWTGASEDSPEGGIDVGRINAGAKQVANLLVVAASGPIPCVLTIEIKYTLLSDPQTPLKKTLTTDLELTAPFEATFNFAPLLYIEKWPSFFDMSPTSAADEPEGIPQKWRLGTMLHSLAARDLTIETIELRETSEVVGATYSLSQSREFASQTLKLQGTTGTEFDLLSRKLSFDDRRPTHLELLLDIGWRRDAESTLVTTTLPVPKLILPSSEPRVLCTVSPDAHVGHVTVRYHLENPSSHFLTFGVTMEANDDFAFGGAKFRSLSVAPLSRVEFVYQLLMHGSKTQAGSDGVQISPVLQVVDSYYNKALRVHSGGNGVNVDDKGRLTIVLP